MKCPSCEAEWQSGKSLSVIESCPFCGASLVKKETKETECIEDVLYSLIEKHGKNLYKKENASKLKSFLSDFAGKFPKERKVLNVVIDEGIQEKLLNIDNGTNDEKHYVIVSCCQRLTEDIGFSENRAKEVVNILATGLGWKIPLSSFVESLESKQNISTDFITQDTEIMYTTPFVELINPTVTKNNADETDSGVIEVTAPVAGTVLRFCVGDGAVVTQGQTIAILESMKIELELKAVQSGKVHFVTPLGSHLKSGQTVATIQDENITNENLSRQTKEKSIETVEKKCPTSENKKPKQKKLFLAAVLIINFILTILISFHFIWERQGFEDIEVFISLMVVSVFPSFTFLLAFFVDPWFKLAFMKGSIPDILDFSPNSYDIGIRKEKSIKMLTIIMEIFNLFYLVLLIYFDLNNRTLKMKEFMVLIFILAVQWVSALIYFRTYEILREYDWYLDKKINSIK